MGWQDRDWAKWNEDERSRFFGGGGSPRSRGYGFGVGAFAAVVVSLVVAVVAQSQGLNVLRLNRAHRVSIPIAPLYGTGVVERGMDGNDITCTELSFDSSGTSHCMGWTYLLPGERALPAEGMPARGTCAVVEADQISRHWVCKTPAAGGGVNS
ncbi:MAG TPA: hypothetical protein VHP82_07970 [Gaiellaceae bacterium]|nr:hypothetical protein [Gaiellaceae bacterium]